MNRNGKLNIVDGCFFGDQELTRGLDFPYNAINNFIRLSTSEYGVVKRTEIIGGQETVTSFRMIYDTSTSKIKFSHDSLAIDSNGNLIMVDAGTPLSVADSLKTGTTYSVGIKYDTTNKEFGSVKLLSIDGKTAEMSWDITGDQPVFSETLRGGSRYPIKISFSKESGTLLNTGQFTVISVDYDNNKAVVVADSTIYTESNLRYTVVGSYEPSKNTDDLKLYTYDNISFYIDTTLPNDYMYVGNIKYNTSSSIWETSVTTSSIKYFSLKNVSTYTYSDDDFIIVNNKVFIINKLNIRTDLTTSDITSTTSGYKGDVSFDANELKLCVSNNSWKKLTLSSF